MVLLVLALRIDLKKKKTFIIYRPNVVFARISAYIYTHVYVGL